MASESNLLRSHLTGPVWTIVQQLSFPFFLQSVSAELPIMKIIESSVVWRGVFIFAGLLLSTRVWTFSLAATILLLTIGMWIRTAHGELSKQK